MTKLLLFSSLFSICCSQLNAQGFTYSKLNQSYSSLTGATELYAGEAWEDPFFFDVSTNPEIHMPLGFEYEYNGFILDSILLYEEGILIFPDSIGSEFTADNGGFTTTQNPNLVLAPTTLDLTDREVTNAGNFSTISYKTEGTAGNKIFKIEYKTVGLYEEDSDLGTTNNYFSFQIWVYESTKVIEYRYGPNTLPNASYVSNNGIGIVESAFFVDTILNGISVQGSNGSETAVSYQNTPLYSNLDYTGLPANGVVYRFAPNPAGLNENVASQEIIVYPNPANGNSKISVKSDSAFETFEIIGMDGLVVANGKLNQNKIQLPELMTGSYFLKLNSGKTVAIEKLMVR